MKWVMINMYTYIHVHLEALNMALIWRRNIIMKDMKHSYFYKKSVDCALATWYIDWKQECNIFLLAFLKYICNAYSRYFLREKQVLPMNIPKAVLKVLVTKFLESEFLLSWQIWSLYKPINHPWWKKIANLYLVCKQ